MHDMMAEPMRSEKEKKLDELGSRIRHYEYAADDYDRRNGKGAFFKKHPESKKILDQLYQHKVACMNHEAMETMEGMEDGEE